MKSTGLFGKNSGRIGGVVYSNYRGQQIVRTYQPKVANPSSARQVEQRQKFKLVSQVGASLGREIALSYRPDRSVETPRNAWLKDTIKKVTYERGEASLSIDDIVLTKSRDLGLSELQAIPGAVTGKVINFSEGAVVRVVQIGYNNESEIVVLSSVDVVADVDDPDTGEMSFNTDNIMATNQYSQQRLLIYVFEPTLSARESYGNYEMDAMDNEAILNSMTNFYAGNLRFSKTANIVLPQNV